ncbi:MAG: amidohydrolase family protein [Deltaproteobacteria bacterium]|nr:amidohydrolase family protein [Deltaproteobacteria bacterium]
MSHGGVVQLVVRDVRLVDGPARVDVAVEAGRVVAVGHALPMRGRLEENGGGRLLSAPFVDAHFHLDSALTLGRPRMNRSGTLLEGIALWGELKPTLDIEEIAARARRYCHQAVQKGILAIRSHVDVCDPRLTAVRALLAVRAELRGLIDLQLVAFPQDGYLRDPGAAAQLEEALDLGVDVVGGIPHFERTAAAGAEATRRLMRLAADRGLRVDMHCDENDDPQSRQVEVLAEETVRLGMQGRVTGSHLTSLHSMDNSYADKLMSLMAEAQLHVVANPLINITLQGRYDSYPRRRGMTRVPELLTRGVNVAFGQDCVMDPWYALGSADMLDVAHMGLHVAQMTSLEGMHEAFAAVTLRPARALDLGLGAPVVGAPADFVLLDCEGVIDALRLRPTRLLVVRGGEVLVRARPIEVEEAPALARLAAAVGRAADGGGAR